MSWPGWGIPVDIPAPANATDTPTSFNRLKFNQLGLYDLRRRIGVLQHARGVFTKYQAKFLASDIAWFAAGAHKDGNHCVPPGEFHSFFKAVREGTMTREERNNIRQQVIELLFDIVSIPNIPSSVLLTNSSTGYPKRSRIWGVHNGHACRWDPGAEFSGPA
jgi:hypothetical protein